MQRKKADYIWITLLSVAFIVSIYRYQTVPKYTLLSSGIYAVSYLLWGVFHEYRSNNLRFKVMLEYLLVATLGVAIVSTLLL